jgi:thiol-disulfide isomerase/thioredoxin
MMPDVGQAAPDFQFTLPDGSVQKLSDLRGKKVVLNFWATWCLPCLDEMPDLDKVSKEYRDSVVIIGVNKAEGLEQIQRFTQEVSVSFALVANPEGDIAQRYRTINLPMSFFINSDGTVGARKLGVVDYTTIKRNVDALR